MHSKLIKPIMLAVFFMATLIASITAISSFRTENKVQTSKDVLICEPKFTPLSTVRSIADLGTLTGIDGSAVPLTRLANKTVVLVFMFNLCGIDCPAYNRWQFYKQIKRDLGENIEIVACVVDQSMAASDHAENLVEYFAKDDLAVAASALSGLMGLGESSDVIFDRSGKLAGIFYVDWWSWKMVRDKVQAIHNGSAQLPKSSVLDIRLETPDGIDYRLGDLVPSKGICILWFGEKDCSACDVLYPAIEAVKSRFGDQVENILIATTAATRLKTDLPSYYAYIGRPIHDFYKPALADSTTKESERRALSDYFSAKTALQPYYVDILDAFDGLGIRSSPGMLIFQDGKMAEVQFDCGAGSYGYRPEGSKDPLMDALVALLAD